MKNREFLQLAHEYNKDKYNVGEWYISEKLDGQRAFWDGGLTRGLAVEEIPFCNLEKSGGGKIATGLWSRYAHPIFAPDYFLNSLPNFALDGELYLGRKRFQELISTTKDHVPGPNWANVCYLVFNAVPMDQVFRVGRINNPNYRMVYENYILEWAMKRLQKVGCRQVVNRPFESQMVFLRMFVKENKHLKLLQQDKLPLSRSQVHLEINRRLDEVTSVNGEGLILRCNTSYWEPVRDHYLLKVKKRFDAEATVIGYKAAELGKIHGRIGALICRFGDKSFDLSGLTDEERRFERGYSTEWAIANPGQVAPTDVKAMYFPRGTVITFDYNELTDDGKPRNAAYLRTKVD